MYTNTELLFPNYVIPALRELRGPEWRQLVDRVLELPADHPESVAFVLMMIRLNGCLDCETDSYRALRGCAACAVQTLRRFRGADRELLDAYHQALADFQEFLAGQEQEEARRIA